jgi:TonB family protein
MSKRFHKYTPVCALVLIAVSLDASSTLQEAKTDAGQVAAQAPASAPLIVKPTLKSAYVSVYPLALYKSKVEGQVLAQVSLDKEGKVLDATVVQTTNADLNESAIAAAKRFSFTPAKKDGEAVPVLARVVINFNLKGAVLDPKDVTTQPQKLTKLDACRPSGMKWHDGEKMTASFDFVVDANGEVHFLNLNKSNNTEYAIVIGKAILRLRFKPATLDGKPVAVIIRDYSFKDTGHVEYIDGW